MTTRLQITVDCAAPVELAAFWATALHYDLAPPPPGFASWHAWYRSVGVPEEELAGQPDAPDRLVDPAGVGPRFWFQPVPEGKPDEPTTDRPTPERRHNRLYLGLRVGDEPRAEFVARLIARATKVWDGRQSPNTWSPWQTRKATSSASPEHTVGTGLAADAGLRRGSRRRATLRGWLTRPVAPADVNDVLIWPMSGHTRRDGPGCRSTARSVVAGIRSSTRAGLCPTPDRRLKCPVPSSG
ncbi:MAG TPA: VOC family protein [Asanoa sp.]|nr:VOC family protein [Asanoa sp.]